MGKMQSIGNAMAASEMLKKIYHMAELKGVNIDTIRGPWCEDCEDTGIVMVIKMVSGMPYQYAARCTCGAGKKRRETAIPVVDSLLVGR